MTGMCSKCKVIAEARVIFDHGSCSFLCQRCAGDAWDKKAGDDVKVAHQLRRASEVDTAIDIVNAPPHYKGRGGMQAIDVIEAFELGYCLGNVIKYVLRAGKKGEAEEDLRKAIWYLQREIESRSTPAGSASTS